MAKKALITAAAGGIGAAIARRARQEGYEVTISDIDREGGEDILELWASEFDNAC